MLRDRPDVASMQEQEATRLQAVASLLPCYRSRPSLLLGPLSAASWALGAAAAAAPRPINLAVLGALQDALSDSFTDQLRSLHSSGGGGAAATAPAAAGATASGAPQEVRDMVRGLRDAERAPEGAPPPPDILAVQQMQVSGGTDMVFPSLEKLCTAARRQQQRSLVILDCSAHRHFCAILCSDY